MLFSVELDRGDFVSGYVVCDGGGVLEKAAEELRQGPVTVGRHQTGLGGLALSDSAKLPGVTALAQLPKRTRAVEWLIERDLALHNHIADAYRSSGTGKADSLADSVPV